MRGPVDRRPGSASELAPAPRRNRAIIVAGLLLCVVGAVALAYLLGLLNRIGLLS